MMRKNNSRANSLIDSTQLEEKAQCIKLLLLDVDGVLTDGQLHFGADGKEYKCFNTLDGHGLKMLQRSGVKVGIISGRTSELVSRRASELGIEILFQGREDKWTVVQDIAQKLEIEFHEIAFMGDDYPDLSVISRIGLGMTVANALPVMVQYCHWQSHRPGGRGAVREACDLIMQAQGTFDMALAQYL